MISRVTVRNFKRFETETFDLADSMVLSGPNNAGKTTLLQAITTWKFGLDRWREKQAEGKALQRSGVPISRADFTPVPLREMNLLWEGRQVTGPKGMSGARRPIEIVVEGDGWKCGLEFYYNNREQMYARPINAKSLSSDDIRNFPPKEAREIEIVLVPPLSGIERDEPRRDRGMQDLLVGQGRPGDILRNLLLEVSERNDENEWKGFTSLFKELLEIELLKPKYSAAQPYIVCEYREGNRRPLDLSNVGSGTLQILLVFAFLYARPASVILLDEPDAHQHIILQSQVYDRVRKVAHDLGGQVIVATHSEVVLDSTDPEHVLGFFGKSPRPLASRTERDQVREALKRVTTTELLLGKETDSILYVEDESDHRILAKWAYTLDHPAQKFFDRPFIRVLHGSNPKDAHDHFFAMRAVCPTIRGLCLLDGDLGEHHDEQKRRGSSNDDSKVKVIRWERYEIENYLLHLDAIKRFVDWPLGDHRIEEEFWKQVPRDAHPFSDIASLTRVKGSDEFLIPLLEKTVRPTMKRDLYQLAEVMKPEEIHPEVKSKLDEIAKVLLPQ